MEGKQLKCLVYGTVDLGVERVILVCSFPMISAATSCSLVWLISQVTPGVGDGRLG